MNEKTEHRRDVLLSMQKALLQMIYPAIRAIAVGYIDLEKLTVIYYLDREPSDDDYENISEVTTEVVADIGFNAVEEFCIYTKEPLSNLDSLEAWVYMREE